MVLTPHYCCVSREVSNFKADGWVDYGGAGGANITETEEESAV